MRRHQQNRKHAVNQPQQRQVGEIGQVLELCRLLQLPGCVLQYRVGRPKTCQGDKRFYQNALQNMTVDLVPKLMGHEGLDLVVIAVLEQGIGNDDRSEERRVGKSVELSGGSTHKK